MNQEPVKNEILDELTSTAVLQAGTFTRYRFFRRLLEHLARWTVVYRRYERNRELKEAIAAFFCVQYLSRMTDAGIRHVFIESGSSTAHLAEKLSDILESGKMERYRRTLQIETNNVLAYMEFVLTPSLKVALYPPEPPAKENNYGATFGLLESLNPPRTGAHPIEGEARAMVNVIRGHFIETYRDAGIIFGATSGIDLSPKSRGFGLHVGDYATMLFKRAMLESECPIVIFLDEEKLPRPYDPVNCYAVCDERLPWEYVCRNHPISLACAFSDEEKANPRVEELQMLGFEHVIRDRAGDKPWCFIASNEPFRQAWTDRRPDDAEERPSIEVDPNLD